MASGLRVRLNEQRCIGCGLCEENVPDIFTMGEFVASVRTQDVAYDLVDELAIAARDCPVNAITVVPTNGSLPHERSVTFSGSSANDHDQEGQNEEEDGQVGQNDGEHGNITNLYDVQTNNAKRIQG